VSGPTNKLPPSVLDELRKCGIPSDAFSIFLSTAGISGTKKKLELVRHLNAARNNLIERTFHEKTKLPDHVKQYRQLNNISTTAIRLLKHLGVANPQSVAIAPFKRGMNVLPIVSSQLLPELQKVACERRPTGNNLDAIARLKALLLLLSDLVEATERLTRNAAKKIDGKRGGVRRKGDTAETAIVKDLIETYAAVNPPPQGKQLSLNKALMTFIRAGISVVTSHSEFTHKNKPYAPYVELLSLDPLLEKRTSHAAIRGTFDRWKTHKPKQQTE